MDFLTLQLFLLLYFIRPQDWIPGLDGARPVLLTMALAILAMVTRRGGVSLKTILQTPHDWLMLAYFCWVVTTAPVPLHALQDCYSRFVFYLVAVLAISSWERLEKILCWWTSLLLVVAALAVGSLVGIDLTGSAATTLAEEGRLSLNTLMLNNPNALGHTVGVAIPLVYFAFFWRRNSASRIATPALIFLAGYCVYETQSKGAFLVGAATLAASQIIGRPKAAQLAILGVTLTAGLLLVSQMPRMETLSRSDEGIQGRLLSWQYARDTIKERPAGAGWNQFVSRIRIDNRSKEIATHGSYIQIGASLGYAGLFLYLGVLYCGMRTVLSAKPRNDQQERIRRMLFCLLFSYALSNWMIDRAYHTEFFVIAAAIAAFHRLSLGSEPEYVEADGTPSPLIPGNGGAVLATEGEEQPEEAPRQLQWTRFGLLDIAATSLLLWLVLRVWDFALGHF